MKDTYIDLNEYTTKKQRVFNFVLYGTLICVGLMFLSLVFLYMYNSKLDYFLFVMPIYLLLYIYFLWISLKAKLFIKTDINSIVVKFGIRNSSRDIILWDSISKVRIGPTYISFFKKTGKRKRYMLGWLPYAKVIEIKDKLIDVFESIGLSYEVVDFVKYDNKPKIDK